MEAAKNSESTDSALCILRRHLNRPLPLFDRYEAIDMLQSLVKVARTEAHGKADEFAAALDEVKARADNLDLQNLQRLMIGLLGDPVRAKIAKEAAGILKAVPQPPPFTPQPRWPQRVAPYGSQRCYNCNAFGHYARNCRRSQNNRGRS